MRHAANAGRERLCPPPDEFASYIPLGIGLDRRLDIGARVMVTTLSYFAGQDDFCCTSDEELAASLNEKPRFAHDAIACLERAGYVRVEATPAGRVVHLLWIYDLSMIPPMPAPEGPANQPIRRKLKS